MVADVELARKPAVADARNRLARLVERVGEAGARRDVVPGERRVVAREVQSRDQSSGNAGLACVTLGSAEPP